MAAAAYKATLQVSVDGKRRSIAMAGSDVNAAAWTFPDATTQNSLGSSVAVITDIIFSAAGTDTSQVDVYVNGTFTNYTIVNSANLYNVLNRQVQSLPIAIAPGATIKFIQKT